MKKVRINKLIDWENFQGTLIQYYEKISVSTRENFDSLQIDEKTKS